LICPLSPPRRGGCLLGHHGCPVRPKTKSLLDLVFFRPAPWCWKPPCTNFVRFGGRLNAPAAKFLDRIPGPTCCASPPVGDFPKKHKQPSCRPSSSRGGRAVWGGGGGRGRPAQRPAPIRDVAWCADHHSSAFPSRPTDDSAARPVPGRLRPMTSACSRSRAKKKKKKKSAEARARGVPTSATKNSVLVFCAGPPARLRPRQPRPPLRGVELMTFLPWKGSSTSPGLPREDGRKSILRQECPRQGICAEFMPWRYQATVEKTAAARPPPALFALGDPVSRRCRGNCFARALCERDPPARGVPFQPAFCESNPRRPKPYGPPLMESRRPAEFPGGGGGGGGGVARKNVSVPPFHRFSTFLDLALFQALSRAPGWSMRSAMPSRSGNS